MTAEHKSTVLVLGAGFTKAFLPNAPLLVDEYDQNSLSEVAEGLPTAKRLLERERAQSIGNSINLERLWNRLAGPMPYDTAGADSEIEILLRRLRGDFIQRLHDAKSTVVHQEQLSALCAACVQGRITCVTFNYDDLMDQSLWEVKHATTWMTGIDYWHPDGGYGFFCPPSIACIDGRQVIMDVTSPLLLKLHGSINWYLRLGSGRPASADAFVHDEDWYAYVARNEADTPRIRQHLEPEPFMVPPILAKSALSEEPILRLVWSLAYAALKSADQVLFVGYSFPDTDLAARYLFGEAVRPDVISSIAVVDWAENEDDRQRLIGRYRCVFPDLTAGQFDFGGAVAWAERFVGEMSADENAGD